MKFDKKIPIFQWILYIQCFETDKFPRWQVGVESAGLFRVRKYIKTSILLKLKIEVLL